MERMTAGPLNIDQEKSMRALVRKTAQLGEVVAAVFDKACVEASHVA